MSNKIDEFTRRQKRFDELEERVKNFTSSSAIPTEDFSTIKEMMMLCLDIERDILEGKRRELGAVS